MKETSIYHGLMIYFLEEKNRVIKDRTGIQLIEEIDIEEINKWPEYKVLKFFERMKTIGWDTDTELCPWCVNNYNLKNNCRGCGYGFRHGKCVLSYVINPKSTYGKIIKALGGRNSSLYNVTHIQVLAIYARNYYNAILSGELSYSKLFREALKYEIDF